MNRTRTKSEGTEDLIIGQAHKLLGEVLVEGGYISHDQLKEALKVQAETHAGYLGQILIDLGHLDQHTLATALVKFCKVPYLSLLNYLVDASLLDLVPEEICLEHHVLPIDKMGSNLTLAVVDPLNTAGLDAVRTICPDLRIKPVLCDLKHFQTVAERLFGPTESEDEEGGSELSYADFGLAAAPAQPEKTKKPVPDKAEKEEDPSLQLGLQMETSRAKTEKEVLALIESTMRDTYEILARKVALFRGVEPEYIAAIFNSGMTKEYEKGDTIFEKGDWSSELYVILGGKVAILDDHRSLATLSAGEMFGEMALLSDAPRSATAMAQETTSVFILAQATFEKIMTKNVAIRILLNMLRISSTRLLVANQIIAKYEQS